MNQSFAAVQKISRVRDQLKTALTQLKPGADAALIDSASALDKKAAELIAVEVQYPPVGIVSAAALNGALGSLLGLVESADAAPTAQANETFVIYQRLLAEQLAKWDQLKGKDLQALNELLRQRQMHPVEILE